MKGKKFNEVIDIGGIEFVITGRYSFDNQYIGKAESKVDFDTVEARIYHDGEEIHFEDAQFLLDAFEYNERFEERVVDYLDEKFFDIESIDTDNDDEDYSTDNLYESLDDIEDY